MDTLDKTDLQILRTLQENARLTTKELAARVNLSSTPVFERLKRLEAQGYIKRIPDAHDRRRYQLQVTDQGMAELDVTRKCCESFTQQMFDHLTSEECEQLLNIIRKISHNCLKDGDGLC